MIYNTPLFGLRSCRRWRAFPAQFSVLIQITRMDIVKAAARHLKATAVRCPTLGALSYEQLLTASEKLAEQLASSLPAARGTDGPRVGVYAEPGAGYVAATWATWMAGGIAVPLAVSHPSHELQYVLQDAGVSGVLAAPSSHEKLHAACQAAGAALQELPAELLVQAQPVSSSNTTTSGCGTAHQHAQRAQTSSGGRFGGGSSRSSGRQRDESGALIVYTSGTTGRPKGALHTHGSLSAQVDCLVSSWQWSPSDTILHALPLHHVHGVINALYCAHAVGATVDFMPKFSPAAMWQQLLSGDVTVLMAVPTMYSYLLSHYDTHLSAQEQAAARRAAAGLRLTVSGSAAAPVPLLHRWQQLSGQMLLERYGMTETGMILSNPYKGERRPGFVGVPLPGMHVKVVRRNDTAASSSTSTSSSSSSTLSGSGSDAAALGGAHQGELAVRGPMMFREYWGRPEATAAAFDAEGYFLTGDTVSLEGQPPYYKILGRTSVDIIKSGGYKLSALDIESTLLHHPAVGEAAVLGAPDEELGQIVTALVYPRQLKAWQDDPQSEQQLLEGLRELCSQELPKYSVPQKWVVLDAPLPRNAMGKVNKKELLAQFLS